MTTIPEAKTANPTQAAYNKKMRLRKSPRGATRKQRRAACQHFDVLLATKDIKPANFGASKTVTEDGVEYRRVFATGLKAAWEKAGGKPGVL